MRVAEEAAGVLGVVQAEGLAVATAVRAATVASEAGRSIPGCAAVGLEEALLAVWPGALLGALLVAWQVG